jgi:hypothetical protein
MTHQEQSTYKLFKKLNAYNDIVKANYNYTMLSSNDKRRVNNGGTAWNLNKMNNQKPKSNEQFTNNHK